MNDACSDTRNATASAISVGCADPAQRGVRRKPRLRRLVEHRRLDRAGKHRVHPDARRRKLGGGDLGQTPQRPLRRAVGGVVGERPDRAGAAGVDDGRAVGRAQVSQRRPDAEERAEAVDPPAALEARRRLVGQRSAVQHTGVVDQGGQRAEPLDCRGHRGGPLLLGRHVEWYRDDARRRRRFHGCLEFVGQQIAGGDPEAVLVQPLDDRRALPARGTGDQRDPVGAH